MLSSTVHPQDLQGVTPAFRTMLQGAFWVALVVPPMEECEEMAGRLAARRNLKLTPDICRMLAEQHASSLQQLSGAVDSLAAYAFLQGQSELDFATARQALARMRRSRTRLPNLSDILKVLLDVFPVTEPQLMSASRCRNICHARHIGMCLARRLTRASLSDIGRFFGGRTHSTAKHAIEKIEREIQADQATAQLVERCERRLRWL